MNLPLGMKLSFKKQQRGGRGTVWGLTPLGLLKANSYQVDGARGTVLGALDEKEIGPSTIGEISTYTKLPPDTVKRVIGDLKYSGYVRSMNKAGE